MQLEISVVIVSYNVKELLRDCLNSIFLQTINDFQIEVIVVDNNSTDGSLKMIKDCFPSVKTIANEINSGFSLANNKGMEISKGKNIFLLNPDTVLKEQCFLNLISLAKKQNELFLIGPRLENPDGTLQISAWKKPGVVNVIAESLFLHRLFGVSEYKKEKFQTQFSPDVISGAALFFPRIMFEKIGGLDENLFWMEDADYSRRAKNAGATLIYFPEAKVTHFSGQSAKKNLNVAISNQLLSKLKYVKKYSGIFALLIASCFCCLQILSRILLFLLLSPLSKNYREKLVAYSWTLDKFFKYLFGNDHRVT